MIIKNIIGLTLVAPLVLSFGIMLTAWFEFVFFGHADPSLFIVETWERNGALFLGGIPLTAVGAGVLAIEKPK